MPGVEGRGFLIPSLKSSLAVFFLVLTGFCLLGCSTKLISSHELAVQLDAVHMISMHQGVFYVGSDRDFHYFVVRVKLNPDQHMKIAREDLDLYPTSPVTRNRERWRALKSGTQGEPQEGYRTLFLDHGRKYSIQAER